MGSIVHSSNHHILRWGCTLFVSHVHHKDERWTLGPKSTTKMKDGFGGTDDQWHSHSLGKAFSRMLRTDLRILSQLEGVRRGEQQQRLGHEPAHHAFPCVYPRFASSFVGEHPQAGARGLRGVFCFLAEEVQLGHLPCHPQEVSNDSRCGDEEGRAMRKPIWSDRSPSESTERGEK